MTLSTTAFAASTSSTNAGAYGTLRGTINSGGYLTASVSQNPDKAYLVLGGTQVARNGNTLVTQQNVSSARGKKYYDAQWNSVKPNAYTLFGVHGVQGGTTYSASATYTSTGVNR